MLLCAFFVSGTLSVMAESLYDGPEAEVTVISIAVTGSTVRIGGASGEVLNVFNLAGVKVGSYRIDSADKTIDLNLSRGCYILKIGNVVRKISIR